VRMIVFKPFSGQCTLKVRQPAAKLRSFWQAKLRAQVTNGRTSIAGSAGS